MKSKLKNILSDQLPGEDIHLEVTPLGRMRSSEAKQQSSLIKPSAVAVLLYQQHGEWYTLLTERPIYPGNHSGQISFPGGKYESEDEILLHTSIRECHEEVAFKPDTSQLIGKLTDVFIPHSHFHIEPYLFLIDQQTPNFQKNDREVASLIQLPISHLIDQKNLIFTQQKGLRDTLLDQVPTFTFQHYEIWGATALILNEVKHIWKQL